MSDLSIRLGAPYLPEGVHIQYEVPLTTGLDQGDKDAINDAIVFIREQTASRSKLDALIGQLLQHAETYEAKENVLGNVLRVVATLLPPEDKLAYARTERDWIKGQNN